MNRKVQIDKFKTDNHYRQGTPDRCCATCQLSVYRVGMNTLIHVPEEIFVGKGKLCDLYKVEDEEK